MVLIMVKVGAFPGLIPRLLIVMVRLVALFQDRKAIEEEEEKNLKSFEK
jgi:hypothetical protein